MNRHDRRAMQSVQRKNGAQPQESATLVEMAENVKNINTQLNSLFHAYRNNFNTIVFLKETLERKGLVTAEDFKETERLYNENREQRETRVKEIYKQNLSDEEKIEICLKDFTEYKHGYQKQNINPVKDLGLSPNVVNDYLIQKGFTGLTYQTYATSLGVPKAMQSPTVLGQQERPQADAQ